MAHSRNGKQALHPNKTVTLLPPEGVPLDFELATLMDRLVALLLDLIVIFVAILLLFLLVYVVILGWLMGYSGGYSGSDGLPFLAVVMLALFFLRQGYFLFFELLWQGSTPGKAFNSIQVVSRDGTSLTASSLIARNLLRDVEVFVPLGLVLAPQQITQLPSWIGIPAMIWVGVMIAIPALNQERLRMGDLIGGTMVVRLPRVVLREDKARQTLRSSSEVVFSPQQLSIYGEYELETLADVLHTIDEGRMKFEDMRKIASTIAAKIKYEGSEPLRDPQAFLQAFYAAQRTALEQKLLFGQRKSSKHDER